MRGRPEVIRLVLIDATPTAVGHPLRGLRGLVPTMADVGRTCGSAGYGHRHLDVVQTIPSTGLAARALERRVVVHVALEGALVLLPVV